MARNSPKRRGMPMCEKSTGGKEEDRYTGELGNYAYLEDKSITIYRISSGGGNGRKRTLKKKSRDARSTTYQNTRCHKWRKIIKVY